MLACATASMLQAPIALPKLARPPMVAMLGVALGCSFIPAAFAHAQSWWLSLLGLVLVLVIGASISYAIFRLLARFDRQTAYFSAMPGGITDMVILAGAYSADEQMVAVAQALRILLVVLLLPLLIVHGLGLPLTMQAGATSSEALLTPDFAVAIGCAAIGMGLGRLLRLPGPYLFGPMALSGILHLTGVTSFIVPNIAVVCAQVVIGATIGCRFANTPVKLIFKALFSSVLATVALIAVAYGFAYGVSQLGHVAPVELVLAYAPGGIAEMGLIALALGIEMPMIVAHHLFRILAVIAGATLLLRPLGFRRAAGDGGKLAAATPGNAAKSDD